MDFLFYDENLAHNHFVGRFILKFRGLFFRSYQIAWWAWSMANRDCFGRLWRGLLCEYGLGSLNALDTFWGLIFCLSCGLFGGGLLFGTLCEQG